MKTKNIIDLAKELREKTRIRKNDPRYRKVIGFLKAKGFLFDETVEPRPNVKLDINDVLWVIEKIEPRVLEVLPAAYLHFKKTFINTAAIPKDLMKIIDDIRKQNDVAGNYNGIELKKMKHWANRNLRDLRAKPLKEQKIPRNYRLRPDVVETLKTKAFKAKLNETAYLEKIILEK